MYPEMKQFLTFDFNGWLDHIIDQKGEARALGFRSCLYKHQNQWLAGAQALAAARIANSLSSTIDAIDALASAAGHGQHSLELGEASPFPSALWKLVEAANRVANDPINLALIVPDDQIFGNPKVVQEGKTRLETLYSSLYAARPPRLMRSRIELVWRSVAVLQAVLDKEELKDKEGEVLVVSVNDRILWRVLELRPWSRNDSGDGPIRIVRTPVNVNIENSKRGEMPWMKDLLRSVEIQNSVDLEKFSQWTRWMEILVTNVSSETLDQLGIDGNAIEHRTWPFVDGKNVSWRTEAPTVVSKNCATDLLPDKLEEVITRFLSQQKEIPLAIIIENPIGDEMVAGLRSLHRNLGGRIQIHHVSGADTARAAARLAEFLAETNHPDSPAWLDSVPEIQLKVREKLDGNEVGSNTSWRAVISGKEVVPAGEIYSTQSDKCRRITLAPGIEYVHFHLRRGNEGAWEERYTQHPIEPSDHVRVVEPLARVRPLSEVARIEIVEHSLNDDIETLAGSTNGIKWDKLTDERPAVLGSIPELFIFRASEEGWEKIKPILEQIVESGRNGTAPLLRIKLRNELYKCTQEQWQIGEFPLGSDGQPPRTSGGQKFHDAQRLLRDAIRILVRDLEYCVDNRMEIKLGVANRLHMGLTWLFTGCPEEVTNILLDAVVNPNGKAGLTLQMAHEYAAWSIYSGVGRTVKSKESLRIIFDTLIERWENNGRPEQDKFLLAAVSHPLARRFLARKILNEDQKRFQRVKHFLCQQLDNIVSKLHDSRPRRAQPSLELRYVIMGYRGLCQIRYKNPEWFPVDGSGECDAVRTYEKLVDLGKSPRFKNKEFELVLLELSAPYLIGKGVDPTMPGRF